MSIRRRQLVRAAAVAVNVLVAAVWLWTLSGGGVARTWGAYSKERMLILACGALIYERNEIIPALARHGTDPGREFAWHSAKADRTVWWPKCNVYSSPLASYLDLAVPIWMVLVATAVPSAMCFWWTRRRRPGHCRCGYSLAGLSDGAACPECGGNV